MRTAYTLDAVTRLYEAALARRSVEEMTAEGDYDFDTIVRAAAVSLEQTGALRRNAHRHELLHDLDIPEFVVAHRAAEALFARIGMTAPPPAEFADAGVDWSALAAVWRRLTVQGADPQLLVTPLLPLAASPADSAGRSWRDLYASLTADHDIANNPLRARPDGHGLHLGAAAAAHDAVRELTAQEVAAVQGSHCVEDEFGTLWTVAVSAFADSAAHGNLPYLAAADDHLSPSEYLALQAQRIVAGTTPVDLHSWTWLRGVLKLDNGRHALAGVWVPGYGQVRLYANPVDYAQERLLARTPVRG